MPDSSHLPSVHSTIINLRFYQLAATASNGKGKVLISGPNEVLFLWIQMS